MERFSKFLITAFFITAIAAPQAMAVNGSQLRAVGAYGEGMGGAVTAAPFDSTTMVTNPAGITEVGGRTDMYFGLFSPRREVDFTGIGGGKDTGGSPSYLLPAIGMSAPLSEGSDLYIGFGMFVLAGMGADFGPMSAPSAFGAGAEARFFTQMQFWQLTPTIAKKFNEQFSAGFSLNIDYQQVDLQQQFVTGAGTGGINGTNGAGAMGYGFTVGALYNMSEKLSFGVNYKSKQSMSDMKYRLLAGDLNFINALGNGEMNTSSGEYGIGLDYPQQYAIGVAFRPMPALLITADYKWINFSDVFDKVDITGKFTEFTGGVASGTANKYTMDFGWNDVTVIAIGAQYQLNDDTWLRFGYNNSNAAVPSDRAFTNAALPAVAEDSFSLGATRNFGENWQAHFSYTALTTNSVTAKNDPGALGAGDGTKISLGGSSLVGGISYRY